MPSGWIHCERPEVPGSTRRLATALCLLALGACTRQEKAPAPEARPAEDGTLCGAAFPEYTPGMSVLAGALNAKLVSAKPSPPRQKIPNHWQLEITDQSGAKVTDVTLHNPDSFMPVHNHHGRTPPSVAADTVRDIDFNMRGPWQVLVDLERGGHKLGTATFQVCVH